MVFDLGGAASGDGEAAADLGDHGGSVRSREREKRKISGREWLSRWCLVACSPRRGRAEQRGPGVGVARQRGMAIGGRRETTIFQKTPWNICSPHG